MQESLSKNGVIKIHNFRHSLVWLRRDLRLSDNTALSAATKSSKLVSIVFVFDSCILKELKDPFDRRLQFIFGSLQEVDHELKKSGSQIVLRYGNPTEEIPKLLEKLKCDALFFNEDYEPYALKRDRNVRKTLEESGTKLYSYKDHVIFSGKEVLKNDGSPYQVFTPYKKAWLKKLEKSHLLARRSSSPFSPSKKIKGASQNLKLTDMGFQEIGLELPFQKAGRTEGLKCLKAFKKLVDNYHRDRDFPSIENGTSGLSVHLRFGTISIRECLKACLNSASEGQVVWMSEFIWREFYQMILANFPHVAKTSFKAQYKDVKWPNSPKFFKAWCAGQTGFPIVDAGMRQLNATGWMHNRVRMITASFLVKDLLVDWKKGEKYFAEKLLDFDLAANNGGWQWCASTGCDAQPYFRIFNPSLQSKRFDAQAEYIKTWVPELTSIANRDIHTPETSDLSLGTGYPKPIVDHRVQKQKALALFKAI